MVNFKVNGTTAPFDGDPDMPLLWYLRDDLRLTGTRFGCGAGLCGACTVHVDGRAVRSCQTPMRTLAEQEGRHDRRAERERHAPGAARLGDAQRRAVRLLPDRPDHAGRGAADRARQSDRSGHRSRHGGQHLPLRHLSAHPRRDQDGGEGAGMSAIENVSRRQFLSGVFSDRRVRRSPRRSCPSPRGRRRRRSARRRSPRRSTRASISASSPTARSSSSRTDPRWAPASARRCRRSRPTSSRPTGAGSRIEQGIGDTRYGDQNTDGSRSIRDFYEAFRHAGASARTMLVSAAAAQWSVPESECTAREPRSACTRRAAAALGYGALVPAAAKLERAQGRGAEVQVRDAWRFVGKDTATYDQKDIVTGKAQFGLDIFRDGMVHASIEHPPVLGGTVEDAGRRGARKASRACSRR